MRAFAEPPLGAVAIGTEELQPFLGPTAPLETTVKTSRKLLPILPSPAFNMIDGEEPPIGLAATGAPAPVGGNHFLPKRSIRPSLGLIRCLRALVALFLTLSWRAKAALWAETNGRPTLVSCCLSSSCLLTALCATLRLSIAWLATLNTTPRPQQCCTTLRHPGPSTFAASFTQFSQPIAWLTTCRTPPFLRITLTGIKIRLLFHMYSISQHAHIRQGF